MEHPNAVRARLAMDSFAAGDMSAYGEFFADDVVWHVSGGHPLSGTYRGKHALFDYFADIRELTRGTLRVDVIRILADDDHIGIFSHVTAERDGRTLDVNLAQAFEVDDDGLWAEYWALPDDQPAVDAFWGGER